MFKALENQKFHDRFKSENDCKEYLFILRWRHGYSCRKCGHKKRGRGQTEFHARCKACQYDESVLANTMFHKLKIPLLKAFGMIFTIALNKKGISSVELARQFGINQKSAWYFKRKTQSAAAMAFSSEDRVTVNSKSLIVDSILLSHREKSLNGLQQFAVIVKEFAGNKSEKNEVAAVGFLPEAGKKTSSNLVKGRFKYSKPDIRMWNLKNWITAIHHHCSLHYLQGYIDEFFFRQNNLHCREQIWHRLLTYMVRSKPIGRH